MPKYQVVHYYTLAETYIVEAETEDEASILVSSGKIPFETKGSPEFSDEIIEEIE